MKMTTAVEAALERAEGWRRIADAVSSAAAALAARADYPPDELANEFAAIRRAIYVEIGRERGRALAALGLESGEG